MALYSVATRRFFFYSVLDGIKESKLIQIDTSSFKQMQQFYVQELLIQKLSLERNVLIICIPLFAVCAKKHKLRAEMNVVKFVAFAFCLLEKFDFSLLIESNDPLGKIWWNIKQNLLTKLPYLPKRLIECILLGIRKSTYDMSA